MVIELEKREWRIVNMFVVKKKEMKLCLLILCFTVGIEGKAA